MLKYLWIAVVVLILDQVTKQLAEYYLVLHLPRPVMPFFNFTLSYNTGAAFSFLNNAGGWQRWFFVILALAVSVGILVWLSKLSRDEKWIAVALSLVLGGAIGNVVDRLLHGHVIDFIHLYYEQWSYPIFNIADSAITVGVAILIIDGLFGGKRATDKEEKHG